MANIIKEILEKLPSDLVSFAGFEGANIVLYTKNEDFFINNQSDVKAIVNQFKKRIELRPDPSITLGMEKTKTFIEKIIPKESNLAQILFDAQRSIVTIEVEKPGVAIGKQGNILKEIREKTLWVPKINRTPSIRSRIIEDVRSVLYENNDEIKKFLNKAGERIYNGWIRGKRDEWLRVSFLGASKQIGRSCFLLQTPESRVLLDCGIDPSVNIDSTDAYPFFEAPEFNLEEIDAVVVSHAHLDHSGMIPYLYRMGYRGPLYCTEPTRDVMALLQLDTIKIAKGEGRNAFYGSEDVKEMVKRTIVLNYGVVTDITPDIRITLYNAGHILGSSMVHIHVGNGLHNLLYTGDLKFGRTRLLDRAESRFPRLESMIIESTYGSPKAIPIGMKETETNFQNIVTNTLKDNGKILIPVLGVGRAQEVMLMIHDLIKTGAIPEIPIYLDGMLWDITAIHTAYPEYLNSKVRSEFFTEDKNPFQAPFFKRVGGRKERMEIINSEGPYVILATSGMLVGGSSVEYFKYLCENPKNSLVFVSYQANGSLGRRVQQGEKEFSIKNAEGRDTVHVKMNIFSLPGLSGHSNALEIDRFIKKCSPRPKKVLIVHGEGSTPFELSGFLKSRNKIETYVPSALDSIRFV